MTLRTPAIKLDAPFNVVLQAQRGADDREQSRSRRERSARVTNGRAKPARKRAGYPGRCTKRRATRHVGRCGTARNGHRVDGSGRVRAAKRDARRRRYDGTADARRDGAPLVSDLRQLSERSRARIVVPLDSRASHGNSAFSLGRAREGGSHVARSRLPARRRSGACLRQSGRRRACRPVRLRAPARRAQRAGASAFGAAAGARPLRAAAAAESRRARGRARRRGAEGAARGLRERRAGDARPLLRDREPAGCRRRRRHQRARAGNLRYDDLRHSVADDNDPHLLVRTIDGAVAVPTVHTAAALLEAFLVFAADVFIARAAFNPMPGI